MKGFITLFLFISISADSISQEIQDTLYPFGDKTLTQEEVDKMVEKAIERDSKDPDNSYLIEFKINSETKSNGILYRYGTMSFTDYATLEEEKRIENKLNSPFPKIALPDTENIEFNIEQYKGKLVIINFWFIECPPCRREIPYLNQLRKDIENEEIEFVAVSPETTEEVLDFVKLFNFNYRQIPNAQKLLRKFGTSFPKTILVDKKGTIRYIDNGIVADSPGNTNYSNPIIEIDNSTLLRIKIDELLNR